MAAILRKLGDWRTIYIFIVALLFLYLAGEADYLLFHTLIELVAVAIAACAFIIAWNGQRLHANSYLLVVGLGFGSVAALTLAHTLVYKGMQVIPNADLTFSTQLWIASRGVLALSLMVAPLVMGRKLRRSMVLYCYILMTALLFGAIFVWRIFPVTFIEGRGVTLFKTLAEYVICGILGVGLVLLWRRREAFNRRVLRYLSAGIIFTIAAELTFSSYVDLFGLSNVIGHLLTLVAFAYFYLAIVRTGFSQPLQLLFRDLKESELTLREAAESWQQTFASVPDLIMVLDDEHRILRANRAMTQTAGMSESELIGRHCFEVLHATSCPPAFCPHTNLLADGKAHRQEVTEPRLGATWEITVTPLRDAAGQVTGSVHVAHNITERKRAEAALRESREDFARAQEVGQIGSWRLDVRRNVLTWSDENHHIFGVPQGTPLTYETFLAIVHPDEREYVDTRWQAGLRGEPYDIEHRIVVAGEVKWVREKAYLEVDEAGKLLGGFGITQDITERKQAEAALAASETRYRRLFESAKDGILIIDAVSGRIIDVNPYLEKMLEYSHSELLGKELWEIGVFKDIAASRGAFVELREKEYIRYEDLPLETKTGKILEVEFVSNVYAVDHAKVVQCNIRDITERKQAEKQMAWLASFPRQNLSPVMEVEADGKLIYANPGAQQVLPDLNARGLAHPWLAGLEEIAQKFREGAETRVVRDVSVGDSWYEQIFLPVRGSGRIRIYATDITERKRSGEALLRERNRMRLLADTAAQLLAAPDPLDAVNELCRGVMEFLDYQMFFVFLADEQADRMHLEAYAGIAEDQAGEMEWLEHGSAFCGCRIPDGEVLVAENIGASADPRLELVRKLGARAFACHPLRLGDQVLGTLSFGCALRDTLTEEEVSLMRIVADQVALAVVRKRSEQKLLETERARVQLAETLVSEIGHRTKNNLAIVSGLLQMQMDQEGEKISGPELIRDAVTRILSFASLHEQMYQSQADSIELVDAIKRIAEIDRQALSAGDVEISVAGEAMNYPSGVGTTLCVVANELLTNALKHSGRQGGGRRVEAKLALAGGELTITVWNSGEALPKNFDIRKRSRTGLGLVHTIVVDQYGGSFTLAPERGGTLARIILSDARLCGGL